MERNFVYWEAVSLGRDGIRLAFRNTMWLDNVGCMFDMMHLHDRIRYVKSSTRNLDEILSADELESSGH